MLRGLPGNCFRFKTIRTFENGGRVPMKVAIIGGGPAGLYSAILLKKQRPEADITVYERNRPDDTFGFGVVFSDATLDNFEKYDRAELSPRSPSNSPIGTISTSTSRAPCTASAATAFAAARAARCS